MNVAISYFIWLLITSAWTLLSNDSDKDKKGFIVFRYIFTFILYTVALKMSGRL